MAEVVKRCVGAVVGSLVADASAMPTHWIYDKEKMKSIMVEYQQKPEFLQTSMCPFYCLPTGKHSSYGDQTFVLLKSLVEKTGLDIDHYKKSLYESFGPNSVYEVDVTYPITKEKMPIQGPWRPASLKEFIKNYDTGTSKTGKLEDAQADGFSKVAPLVALHAGLGDASELLEEVERAIRVTQEDDTAVKCGRTAASILEKCILGKSFKDAIMETYKMSDDEVKSWIDQAIAGEDKSHVDFVQKTGTSCRVPGNFINSVHCLLNSSDSFRDTVVMTIAPGGCTCSRCCFVGACAGAAFGVEGIPQDWISKTTKAADIVSYTEKLVSFRH